MTRTDRLPLERLHTRLEQALRAQDPNHPKWLVHVLHDALFGIERILTLESPGAIDRGRAVTLAEAALSAFSSRAATRCLHTVLIVDDDHDIRETFSNILEDEGYATLTVPNGADAMHLLEERERPCVVVVDLMMPYVDGWELIGKLGAHEELAVIPIVVVTAFAEHAPVNGRVSAVLKKPVDAHALIGTVARLCKAA
jgi:CheY-like chemotaxis protein